MLVYALLLEFRHNPYFRGDTRMVCSRLPERIISLHSLKPYKNVLHSIVKGMSHMKLPRNVRRRHHYSEGLFRPVYFCMKIAVLLPLFV